MLDRRNSFKLLLLGGLLALFKSSKSEAAPTWTEVNPATATGISTSIHASALKTPIDADELGFVDSSSGWSFKKITFASLKAFLFGSPTFTGTTTANIINANTINGSFNGNFMGSAGNTVVATANTNNNLANFSGEALSARGNGIGAAAIALHRPGAFACFLGLDTDNKLKVGGWSMGAVAYPIATSANFSLSGTTLTITI